MDGWWKTEPGSSTKEALVGWKGDEVDPPLKKLPWFSRETPFFLTKEAGKNGGVFFLF